MIRTGLKSSIRRATQQEIQQTEEQRRIENEKAVQGEILDTKQATPQKTGGLLSLKTDIKEEKKTQLGKERKFAQVEGSFGVIQLG